MVVVYWCFPPYASLSVAHGVLFFQYCALQLDRGVLCPLSTGGSLKPLVLSVRPKSNASCVSVGLGAAGKLMPTLDPVPGVPVGRSRLLFGVFGFSTVSSMDEAATSNGESERRCEVRDAIALGLALAPPAAHPTLSPSLCPAVS